MAMLTIPRGCDDAFYRYKMHDLVVKKEGPKTVLINLEVVAKDLQRVPSDILKFLGIQMGTQTIYKGHQYFLNGNHTKQELLEQLDVYINRYILCTQCGNPETQISVHGGKINLTCKACGYITTRANQTKMDSIIIQNSRKTKKATSVKSPGDVPKQEDFEEFKDEDVEDTEQWSVDSSVEAVKQR
jgi:translation initiation factor 5